MSNSYLEKTSCDLPLFVGRVHSAEQHSTELQAPQDVDHSGSFLQLFRSKALSQKVSWAWSEDKSSLLTECSMCQPGYLLTCQVTSTSGTKNSREDTSSVSFLFNGKLELYLTSEVITHCINNCKGWYADHRWPVGNSRHRQNGPGAI